MAEKPQLSVIVPVFNVEYYLKEALDSLLDQSYENLEIIAVNDGSTDKSGEILECYQSTESRISVFHRSHNGLAETRNFGLTKAKGEYIYFFDSDDRLLPGAFHEILDLMQRTNSEICAFSGVSINEKGVRNKNTWRYQKPDVLGPVPGEQLFVKMNKEKRYSPVVSMYIYSASLLKRHEIRFTTGFIHEDEAFTAKALTLAKRSNSLEEIYYEHRIRNNSIMGKQRSLKNVEGWLQAYTDIMNFSRNTTLDFQATLHLEYRANFLLSRGITLFHELKKEGRIQDRNMWEFINTHNYQPYHKLIKMKCYAPLIYRIVCRLKWIYASLRTT